MNAASRWAVATLLAAPAMALAQVSISEVRIVPDPSLPMELRRSCMERVNVLHDRRGILDEEKLFVDREGDALAVAGQRLADELRSLDSADAAAVAAYSARSGEHNRRVEAQNRRVAELNARAAAFNADAADAMRSCQR
jgi:hypothetical protein